MESPWKKRCLMFDNCIWIAFVGLVSLFSREKYGAYHKAMADKSNNNCQEYVFNMHTDNCELYVWYISECVCFVLLFAFHLCSRCAQKRLGGEGIHWPTYIRQILFPHLLISANFATQCIIANENPAYWVQIFTDLSAYLLFFSFVDHGERVVKQIMSLHKKNINSAKNLHENSRIPKQQCDPQCNLQCDPQCNLKCNLRLYLRCTLQCNLCLALNVLICVWVHLDVIWYMLSKLDEDYNWEEISDKNRTGNFKWNKGEKNAIFWQIQWELLILIQWVKGSIENIVHAAFSKGGHSHDHTPNLNNHCPIQASVNGHKENDDFHGDAPQTDASKVCHGNL